MHDARMSTEWMLYGWTKQAKNTQRCSINQQRNCDSRVYEATTTEYTLPRIRLPPFAWVPVDVLCTHLTWLMNRKNERRGLRIYTYASPIVSYTPLSAATTTTTTCHIYGWTKMFHWLFCICAGLMNSIDATHQYIHMTAFREAYVSCVLCWCMWYFLILFAEKIYSWCNGLT